MKNEIEDKVKRNRPKEALEILFAYAKQIGFKKHLTQITVLFSNLKQLNEDKDTGQINSKEYGLRIARINYSILRLANEVFVEQSQASGTTIDRVSWKLLLPLFMLMIVGVFFVVKMWDTSSITATRDSINMLNEKDVSMDLPQLRNQPVIGKQEGQNEESINMPVRDDIIDSNDTKSGSELHAVNVTIEEQVSKKGIEEDTRDNSTQIPRGERGAQDQSEIISILSNGLEIKIDRFDDTVEISVEDFEGVIDADEAIRKIKVLFRSGEGVSTLSVIHQGAQRGNEGRYAIGNMHMSNNVKYRVYVSVETESGSQVVKEIRFAKD